MKSYIQFAGIFLVAVVAIILVLTVNMGQQVQEDSPRWNCETMGNRVCGNE